MAVWSRRKGSAKPFFYKFEWKGRQIRGFSFQTREEAALAEARERVKLAALTASDTFAVLAGKRLEIVQAYSTPLWHATTKSYLKAFKAWALIPAMEISTGMVRDIILKIARERGNRVANKHLVILKSVFNQAVRDGSLMRNPAIAVAPLPVESAPKRIPSREDIDKVIAAAPYAEQAYLATILFTGARVGEINNLTWEDVDLERRTVRLWTKKKKGGSRKYRTVHIIERVYKALVYMWDHRSSLWVFTNPVNGKAYVYRDKFLKTLCRKVGVPEFTYHHLRHYTASALMEAGVPVTTIQKILGHERATTTDLYLQDLGRADTALEILNS